MTKEELYQLTTKFLNETLSADEKERLEQWYRHGIDEEIVINVSSESSYRNETELKSGILQRINRELANEEIQVTPVRRMRHGWWAAAAAVVLMLGAGTYVWFANQHEEVATTNGNKRLQTDIAPGSSKAVLTLADGSTMVLDDAQNGDLVQQGNAKVVKLATGQLAYKMGSVNVGKEVLYNTISTPRGGQYQIVLPDGTKVWLNAASSIKFPTTFAGTTRNIEMAGEVYLEVAKNSRQPFMVKANGVGVQVLGTSFNVNAYADEAAIRTTLIDGSVKVTKGESVILKPGQQASVFEEGELKVQSADVNGVLAWKRGLFSLDGADFLTVMRQLERWYDIKIKIEGKTPQMVFKGKMGRDLNLSEVLAFLSKLDVKFKLDGRTLIVNGD